MATQGGGTEQGSGRGPGTPPVEPSRELLALSIPAEVASIPAASSAILQAIGREESDVLGSAALAEALLNAVVHGALGIKMAAVVRDVSRQQAAIREAEAALASRPPVEIAVRSTGTAYEVVITDPGEGFDWRATLAPPTGADDDADLLREGGRGLLIIRAACQAISYNERGNQVTLVFDAAANAAPGDVVASDGRAPRPDAPHAKR